jgi:LysR family transcriptional regulator, regulator for metE and metH
MEIKYLKLIRTIAEEGNLSGSAQRLFLTQSALSHQLREIEEKLGLKVFFRTRNRWHLTEEGKELYALSVRILSEVEKSLSKIHHIQAGSAGKIRISTECYSFYQGLPAFIQKMGLLYRDMEIELVVEATHHPIDKLLANELDLAIVTTKPSHNSLRAIEFFRDEILAVVHTEHPLGAKANLEAADFTDLHLIIHSFPLETVSVYQHFLRPHSVQPAKVTAIPLTEVALEMVAANMGIVCMPAWALNAFKLPDCLLFKPLGDNRLKRKHYLILREQDQRKKYIVDFIENLQEEFTQVSG